MAEVQYSLNKPLKTRFLNLFRRILTIPSLERIVASRSSLNPGKWWKKVVPPDYLYPKGSIRKVVREDVTFELDVSNNVEHSIYFFGLQARGFLSAAPDIARSNVIFDIGAFISTASIIFSRLNKNASIIAFEPDPDSYNKAMQIQNLNSFPQISVNNIGLGDKKGKMKLYNVRDSNAGMNRILEGDHDYPYVEVPVNTLDSFVEENSVPVIDFIKLDVEGFEYHVLKGGENVIRKFMPVMFVELIDDNLKKSGYSANQLINLLNEYGYTSIVNARTNEPVIVSDDFTGCHYDIIARK